jgi:hypothetical protein
MNIILFTTLHGRPGSLNLSRPRCYIPLLSLVFMICGLLLYTGYRLGDAGSTVAGREGAGDGPARVAGRDGKAAA